MKTRLIAWALALSAGSAGPATHAQQGPSQAGSDEVVLTAISANVAEPGNPVRIRILRWSTDEERAPLTAALNPPAPAAGRPAGAGPGASAAGEGGGAARGGRAGGRGARGRGRGDAAAAPLSPTAALTATIARAPTIGYIWTNDVTGYSIKYAWRAGLPDGGERIIIATDRRLGAHAVAWTPAPGTTLTDYEFTLVEVRLDPKGVGEGKTSHLTKVIVDEGAQTIALENFTGTPALLRNVKAISH